MSQVPMTLSEIDRASTIISESGLFKMTKQDTFALMMIAQAEGLHPAIAIRDYHIIEGKPALRADAMLARFQQAGGRVEWRRLDAQAAIATFTHPAGGSVEIEWNMEMATAAELTTKTQRNGGKNMWQKYPRQMLRSRVISDGIRTVFPGVIVGAYTPEEVMDEDIKDVTPPAPKTPLVDAKKSPKKETADPKTGQIIDQPIGPHTIPIDVVDKGNGPVNDMIGWAKKYIDAINSCSNLTEIDAWLHMNFVVEKEISDNGPKLHARIMDALQKKRAEFAPKDDISNMVDADGNPVTVLDAC